MDTAYVLGIETSAARGGVALLAGDEVLGERSFSAQRRQAAELAPLMQDLLRGAGLACDELAAVAVSIGPGSYTGLRVGVSAAKAVCWAANVPLVPVCSLEALAHEVPKPAEPGTVLVTCREASGGKVYARPFVFTSDGKWQAQEPAAVREPSALAAELAAARAETLVLGCGARLLAGAQAAQPHNLKLLDEPTVARAATVARLGREGFENGAARTGRDVHATAPVYLRPGPVPRRRAAAPDEVVRH